MRITENKRLIANLPREYKGTTAEIANQLRASILKVLVDISISLAGIADAQKAEQKAKKAARRAKND